MSKPNDIILHKPKEFTEFLEQSRAAFKAALPSHVDVGRFFRIAVTQFSTNPNLRKCTAQSIRASLMLSAQLGLEPGITGQGYLIPYKTTCTFVPGWQGLTGLLNNTGRATIWSGAVFEGDVFEFELGAFPKLRHVPGDDSGDPDKLKWVYAVGKINGSEVPVIECWNISRVLKHLKRYNKVGDRHYAWDNMEMYARKVVVLQVLKYMPKSVNLENAMAAAHAAEMGNQVSMEDGVIVDVGPPPGEDASVDDLANAARIEQQPQPQQEQRAPRQTRSPRGQQPKQEQAPAPEPEPEPQGHVQEEEPPATVVDNRPEPQKTPAQIDRERRDQKFGIIKAEVMKHGINPLHFEKALRDAGILAATEMVGSASLSKLDLIIESMENIIDEVKERISLDQ